MKQQLIIIVVAVLAICNAELYFTAPADGSSNAIYSLDVSNARVKMFYKGDQFSTFSYNPTESDFYTISANSSGATLTRINLRGKAIASFSLQLPNVIIRFLAYSQAQGCFVGAGSLSGDSANLFYFTMDTNGKILSQLTSDYKASILKANFAYNDKNSTVYVLFFTQYHRDQHIATWNYQINKEVSVSKYVVANETNAIGTEVAYGPYLISATLVTDEDGLTQAGYATVEDNGVTAVATIQDPASFQDGYVIDIIWDNAKKIWYAIEANSNGYYFLVVYDSEGNPTRKGRVNIDQMIFPNFSLLLVNS